MKAVLRIAFHHLTPSAALEEDIRKRIDKLGLLFGCITACRVTVEAPHRHHHKGAGFEVRIEISVPGREIVVHRARRNLAAAENPREADELDSAESRRPSRSGARGDVYAAVHDAFDAAGRKLAAYVGRRNDALKAEPAEVPT